PYAGSASSASGPTLNSSRTGRAGTRRPGRPGTGRRPPAYERPGFSATGTPGCGPTVDRPAGRGFGRSPVGGPASAVRWPGWKSRGGGRSDMAGQVVHFEIPADDMERAQAFYREAFGWRLNPMPEMSYTLVTTVEPD